MTTLDSTAIALATEQLQQPIQHYPLLGITPPLTAAIAALDLILPEPLDVPGLLTWATAAEQLAATLAHEQTPWIEALQVVGAALRQRAHTASSPGNTYG